MKPKAVLLLLLLHGRHNTGGWGQWNRARGQNNTPHSAATWTPTHERSLHMTRETESLDHVTPVQDWE